MTLHKGTCPEPPPTVEHRGREGREIVYNGVAAVLREEANKLERIIRGRTLGSDVCLDPQEARELVELLRTQAAKLNCQA